MFYLSWIQSYFLFGASIIDFHCFSFCISFNPYNKHITIKGFERNCIWYLDFIAKGFQWISKFLYFQKNLKNEQFRNFGTSSNLCFSLCFRNLSRSLWIFIIRATTVSCDIFSMLSSKTSPPRLLSDGVVPFFGTPILIS